ncbi:calcium/sodium antiporter [Myxococcota bacterium]|nr:calcium/sodium antiporter [Myxococcota bacterium]MBU1412203.1 calcium/sodium antiporter [Myxococcota bacterium]MBU1511339.1 calcium/sodium antiporter [Myxococcota bacterium]
MLWLSAVELIGGFVLLAVAANWLIAGASSMALQLGISASVVGLTVIAYGTSLPEMTVSAVSAVSGNPQIALGNVIGSNIANIALIIGLTALFRPMPVDKSFLRRDFPVLALVTGGVIVFLADGTISRFEGMVLFLAGLAYTVFLVISTRGKKDEGSNVDVPAPRMSRPRQVLLIVLGLAGLLAGGRLGVMGAIGFAEVFGLSERVIGLTIVAIGTSLPELAASLAASFRNQSAMALGNILGSNIFNIIFVLGVSAMIHAITVPGGLPLQVDLNVMVAFTLAFGLFMLTRRRVSRLEGALLVAGYAGYTTYLVVI